jgi:hypothetical protein
MHWQHLRSEKAWKPIVCLELDGRPCYELVLGVDGQNPNLREPAALCASSVRSVYIFADCAPPPVLTRDTRASSTSACTTKARAKPRVRRSASSSHQRVYLWAKRWRSRQPSAVRAPTALCTQCSPPSTHRPRAPPVRRLRIAQEIRRTKNSALRIAARADPPAARVPLLWHDIRVVRDNGR